MIKNYVDAEDTDFFKDVIFDNLKNNVCEEDELFDNLLTFYDLSDNLKICLHLRILVKISKKNDFNDDTGYNLQKN